MLDKGLRWQSVTNVIVQVCGNDILGTCLVFSSALLVLSSNGKQVIFIPRLKDLCYHASFNSYFFQCRIDSILLRFYQPVAL